MKDIFDKIKSLLKSSKESGKPFVHEMIERSNKETESHIAWAESPRKELLFSNIKAFLENPEADYSNFQSFQNERSYTFVFYFEGSGMEKTEMQYYFDHLKERVLELEYNLYMSDRKIKAEPGNVVKTIERHYLKPLRKQKHHSDKAEQQYGNIAIEHHLRDDVPEFVKLNASYYQDHLYKDVKAFPELLKLIFK
ncbi:MAG: hypothetical protein WD334_08895 [Chitinophagales bacterium]